MVANDNDEFVEIAHKKNLPHIPFVFGDISQKKTRHEVLSVIGERHVDVPWRTALQGFSIFGKRRFVNMKITIPLKILEIIFLEAISMSLKLLSLFG